MRCLLAEMDLYIITPGSVFGLRYIFRSCCQWAFCVPSFHSFLSCLPHSILHTLVPRCFYSLHTISHPNSPHCCIFRCFICFLISPYSFMSRDPFNVEAILWACLSDVVRLIEYVFN